MTLDEQKNMILLLIFLFLNAKISAKTFKMNDNNCGRSAIKSVKNYIIGGEDADIEEFPFMVSLQIKNKSHIYNHFCGASIISDRWLMTAAHCIVHSPDIETPSQIAAVIGTTNNRISQHFDETRFYKIQKWIIHGCYSRKSQFSSDIALLKTTEVIRVSQTHNSSGAVCLPPQDGNPISDKGIALGWGVWKPFSILDALFNQQNIQFADKLQKSDLDLFAAQLCETILFYKGFGFSYTHTEHTVCVKSRKASPCNGDSGGALVQKYDGRYYQIGVTSYGVLLCEPNSPTTYTQVSHYVEWITRSIKLVDEYFLPSDKLITECDEKI